MVRHVAGFIGKLCGGFMVAFIGHFVLQDLFVLATSIQNQADSILLFQVLIDSGRVNA